MILERTFKIGDDNIDTYITEDYQTAIWENLIRYVQDPEAKIDNNFHMMVMEQIGFIIKPDIFTHDDLKIVILFKFEYPQVLVFGMYVFDEAELKRKDVMRAIAEITMPILMKVPPLLPIDSPARLN